jgi:hypothetical protein
MLFEKCATVLALRVHKTKLVCIVYLVSLLCLDVFFIFVVVVDDDDNDVMQLFSFSCFMIYKIKSINRKILNYKIVRILKSYEHFSKSVM